MFRCTNTACARHAARGGGEFATVPPVGGVGGRPPGEKFRIFSPQKTGGCRENGDSPREAKVCDFAPPGGEFPPHPPLPRAAYRLQLRARNMFATYCSYPYTNHLHSSTVCVAQTGRRLKLLLIYLLITYIYIIIYYFYLVPRRARPPLASVTLSGQRFNPT